jgi:hypothetical protein
LTANKVVKLNIQNPSNITSETYSPATDRIYGFVTNISGNMIYFGHDSSNTEISRIKRPSGELKNLSSQDGRFAWVGPDNNIYFYGEGVIQIKKYNAGTNAIEDFGSEISDFGGFGGSGYLFANSRRVLLCSVLQHFVFEAYPNPRIIQGYYGSTSQSLGLKSIKLGTNSENYYYIVGANINGDPVLVKINFTNDSPTTILSGYDVYKFTVNPNDVVTFNALRMSDGAIVIGEISASGQIKILDTALNTEVVVLERIK